jgi:hypothetical protein
LLGELRTFSGSRAGGDDRDTTERRDTTPDYWRREESHATNRRAFNATACSEEEQAVAMYDDGPTYYSAQ